MKLKYANRPEWKRISKNEFSTFYKQEPHFKGMVSYYKINEVHTPLWVEHNQKKICIVDNGYTWMQHFPTGANYTLTTMIDPENKIVQWYIDICKDQGITGEGIPWYNDLYLDIVFLPNYETFILDEDELIEALDSGKITSNEYSLAWKTTKEIIKQQQEDSFYLLDISKKHLEELKKEIVYR
ncbi:DUF402 domain-containing protein [Chengkuizengella axinellae]|uniref:DUF402 domain-containing protein n=1 Tax=Chengkuizengella axinellae TaxID=3064388 RepID=A0ABT9IZU1_9BACL|nr:DUF402 domain-containing protein [Chengkuizengella sp. 2205SS18-9]MDP5274894.1 DUF402 domain-containing protein [Chengkuizengella sp. 2205SS18-9]